MDKLKEIISNRLISHTPQTENLIDQKEDEPIVDLGTGTFMRGIVGTVMKELYALWLIPLIIIFLFLVLHTVELIGIIQILQGKISILKSPI